MGSKVAIDGIRNPMNLGDQMENRHSDDVAELQRFCDEVGKCATQRGLTENKLAEILGDNS